MVGIGTLLFLVALWYGGCWLVRRDMPRSKPFLWVAMAAGPLALVAMEAGWVVSEVGRQPWIVYEFMKVEDAATANTGVWVTTILVGLLYTGLGVTTVLVLRGMSRRSRAGGEVEEAEVPYGPSSEAAGRTAEPELEPEPEVPTR
jgi:cytochrome d ubiquinol oxidase subunit I